MSPSSFWDNLISLLTVFYIGIVRNVIIPLFYAVTENVFLLLIFGFSLLGVCISIFKRLNNG